MVKRLDFRSNRPYSCTRYANVDDSHKCEGVGMKRVVATLFGAVMTAVALASPAQAIPEQGTPEFEAYMQGLQRNGYNLNPDTAWRVAHQACVGGIPGYIGLELAAQGVIGPGAQDRVMDVARKYACPVQ